MVVFPLSIGTVYVVIYKYRSIAFKYDTHTHTHTHTPQTPPTKLCLHCLVVSANGLARKDLFGLW